MPTSRLELLRTACPCLDMFVREHLADQSRATSGLGAGEKERGNGPRGGHVHQAVSKPFSSRNQQVGAESGVPSLQRESQEVGLQPNVTSSMECSSNDVLERGVSSIECRSKCRTSRQRTSTIEFYETGNCDIIRAAREWQSVSASYALRTSQKADAVRCRA